MFKQSSYIPPGAILPNMPVRVPHLAMPQPVLFKFNVDNDKKINTDNLTDQAKKYIDEKIASLSLSGATINTDKIKQEVIDALRKDITEEIKKGCKCGKDDLKSVVQEIMSESYEGRIKQNEENIQKIQAEIKQNIEGFNDRLFKLETQEEAVKLLQEFETFTKDITAQLDGRDSVINKEIQAKLADFQEQLKKKIDEFDNYIATLIQTFEARLTKMENEFKLPNIDEFETEVGSRLQEKLQQFINGTITAFITEQRHIISMAVGRAEKKLEEQNKTHADSLLELFEINRDDFFAVMNQELKRIKQEYGAYAVGEIKRIVEDYNQETLRTILQDFKSKVDAINTRLQNAISPEDLLKITQDIDSIKSQFETELGDIKEEAKKINKEFRQLNRQVKGFTIEEKLKELREELEGINTFMGEELERLTGEVTRAQQAIDAAKQEAENSAQEAQAAAETSIQHSKEIESLLGNMRKNDIELRAMISKSHKIHTELSQLRLGLKQFETQLTGEKYNELLAKINAIDKKHSSMVREYDLGQSFEVPIYQGIDDFEQRLSNVEKYMKEKNDLLRKQINDKYSLLSLLLIQHKESIEKNVNNYLDDQKFDVFRLVINNNDIFTNEKLLKKIFEESYDEKNLIMNEKILIFINNYFDLLYNYLHTYILSEINKIILDIYDNIKPEYEQLKERHESLNSDYSQLYDAFYNTKEVELKKINTSLEEQAKIINDIKKQNERRDRMQNMIEKMYNMTQDKIKALGQENSVLLTRFNSGFELINSKTDRIDTRIDEMDKLLQEYKGKIPGDLQEQLNQHLTEIQQLQASLQQHEQQLTQQQVDLQQQLTQQKTELQQQLTQQQSALQQQQADLQKQGQQLEQLETSEFKNAEVIAQLEGLKTQLQEQITGVDTRLQKELTKMLQRVNIVEQTNTIDFSVYQRLNTILLIIRNIEHSFTGGKLNTPLAKRLNTELETVIEDINTIIQEQPQTKTHITNIFIIIYILMILDGYNKKCSSFSLPKDDQELLNRFNLLLKELNELLPENKRAKLKCTAQARAQATKNKYEIIPVSNIQKGGASNYLMFAKSICSSF
jgi:hypothetical protein